ncbi:hypothetical protein MC885_009098 [Smutsia gigantea]|nr:hypothetical protein MC885_009098 [Smutsia gigantea]
MGDVKGVARGGCRGSVSFRDSQEPFRSLDLWLWLWVPPGLPSAHRSATHVTPAPSACQTGAVDPQSPHCC